MPSFQPVELAKFVKTYFADVLSPVARIVILVMMHAVIDQNTVKE